MTSKKTKKEEAAEKLEEELAAEETQELAKPAREESHAQPRGHLHMPSVGRQLYYFYENTEVPCPATVTAVHSPTCVNLAVIDEANQRLNFVKTVNITAAPERRSACWPQR